MSEELKSCPFCGGKAILREQQGISEVWCEKCGVSSGLRPYDNAIKRWNTRPIEYGLEVENECLRKTLCEIRKALYEIMELRNLNNNLKYTNTPSCAEDIFANFYCIMGDIAIKALNKVYKEN